MASLHMVGNVLVFIIDARADKAKLIAQPGFTKFSSPSMNIYSHYLCSGRVKCKS